jgi:peptidoglycan/xylan/chitin deacetylase (PgdA/CDA1 family)
MNKPSWSRLPASLRHRIALIPQSTIAAHTAYCTASRPLRILAFHGVTDLDRFDDLVRAICLAYRPVSADDVASALRGDAELPDHPVWFTFDDGLASTFQAGQLLAHHGVRATAFVCPGVIGSGRGWLWFQAVQSALSNGLVDLADEPKYNLGNLKALPDDERRILVDILIERLSQAGELPPPAAKVGDLRVWCQQGHTVGNHTLDHPCLDTCSPDEQRRQIQSAHRELVAWGIEPQFFAYPNGNWTAESAEVVHDLDYVGALLFDHRLAKNKSESTRLSRLRIDSDAPPRRAMSILSGAHSFAYHLSPG